VMGIWTMRSAKNKMTLREEEGSNRKELVKF